MILVVPPLWVVSVSLPLDPSATQPEKKIELPRAKEAKKEKSEYLK